MRVVPRLRNRSRTGVYVGSGHHRSPSRHLSLVVPCVRRIDSHRKASILTERVSTARCAGLASRPSVLVYFISSTAATSDVMAIFFIGRV